MNASIQQTNQAVSAFTTALMHCGELHQYLSALNIAESLGEDHSATIRNVGVMLDHANVNLRIQSVALQRADPDRYARAVVKLVQQYHRRYPEATQEWPSSTEGRNGDEQ